MKQLITMGGGGFSMEPDNLLLDRYVLQQTGKAKPKVCFVPTASGDSLDYTERFYKAMGELNCEPSHLHVFRPPSSDLEAYVLDKDILYVGGGNTRNLLVLWREWGLDQIFKKAWEEGVLLTGLSAGMICWFEQGITDSNFGQLSPLSGLGFLPGSASPHYDGEAQRRPSFQRMILEGALQDGLAADDGAAFHFIGTDLHRTVSSRPNAKGYRVQKIGSEIREEMLDTYYLGNDL
ncbi:peptidase E [Tumebacillus algifaecis]|uniref:Peptidase E n=1 Tax=Tumebacillus algifaecis TaxID=1214604 RepID=A0A223D4A5_9BACL|nr:peptidase E [Tumebacillus algifaecis]ASS76246.1 peptidase E [Tumebacillus algifaecis]